MGLNALKKKIQSLFSESFSVFYLVHYQTFYTFTLLFPCSFLTLFGNPLSIKMRNAFKILRILLAVAAVIGVHALFFVHHPPEVQLAFLTPGVTLVAYSLIRDELYVKPSVRLAKGR